MKTPEELAEEYADTQHYDVDQEWSDSYKGFLAGYQAAALQWISVKDRLPETNELCIVNTEWRAIVPALYGNESWIFDEGQGWSEKVLSYVSHWMPLPEPPKDE
jgi:hypothetical protein